MLCLTLFDILFNNLFNNYRWYLKDGLDQLSHLSVFLFLGYLHEKEEVFVPMHSDYFTFCILRRKFCSDPFLDDLNVRTEFSYFLGEHGSQDGDPVS